MLYKRVYSIVTFILMLGLIGGAIADVEINLFLLNTEFFFDNEEPHGSVVGKSVPVPTLEQYEAKAIAIAELIDKHEANLVGLVEVENRAVLEKVRAYLTNRDDWNIVFDEGRDTFTGQDVAILTKFRVESGSVTNFPEEREVFFDGDEERDVNPSKILGVELKVGTEPVYVLITHLISRRGTNDAKRLAQANVVRRQAVKAMIDEKHVIVMGDMNDTPGTPVIKRLRGFDDIWGDLIQTANAVEANNRYTYIYQDQKNLLDHVLISPSLRNEFRNVKSGERCEIIDVGELSDHRAIIARLRMLQPIVVMETDKGTVEIELYPNVAPKTVANFIKLIQQKFYDGLTFHRYVENFVIQGGDPSGDGSGGPGWSIEGEFENPKLRRKMPRHGKGVVAMARTSIPDSAGSQFYICLDTNPSRYRSLNGNYTTFGKVIAGMDVVDQLRKGDKMIKVALKKGN
ncbi:MAG: peptidylprolyl isomerase [Candidatus Poribacteria bacterium]|nr:peptidylprolyl isomerase [Candidatus Poribacteria bacterium]